MCHNELYFFGESLESGTYHSLFFFYIFISNEWHTKELNKINLLINANKNINKLILFFSLRNYQLGNGFLGGLGGGCGGTP